MEKFVQQTFLYDFYGELLTEHQRQVYEQVVFEDLSPSEAAQNQGISRQGVHDLIKRCNRILEDYESRLHLVEKFLKIRDNVRQIQQLTDRENGDSVEERMREIRRISSDILEEL
ncbi:MAG TPA: YlxM family DNA-binding protein [Candidatus Scatomonas merdigallinarum]|nr:YlxM family DNA-binding protein [Candidatus Scatomonas merdigallinarum]